MRQRPVGFSGSATRTNMPVEVDGETSVVPTDTAAEVSPPSPFTQRAVPRASHLQAAWRVRQFAARGYFGSATIPRLMTQSDLVEVQQALDRLGPFGNDRIDNHARLHTAIISANAASAHAVLTLVRHRIINPNQRGPDGGTLLHSLVEHGRLQPAEHLSDALEPSIGLQDRLAQLLAAGANPNATDREGRTAFDRILSSARPDWRCVADAFLQAAPERIFLNEVKNHPTLLHRAARQSELTIVERWLALRLPLDIGAVSWRDIRDQEVRTPLRRALKNQSLEGVEITRLLVDGRADYNLRSPAGYNMLHQAAESADVRLLKGWIAAGLPLNDRLMNRARSTALMLAVRHQAKRPEVLMLLAQPSTINAQDTAGATALHHAASAPKLFCALDALIAAGANLNIQTDEGKSPLEVSILTARNTRNDAAFWTLLRHGADLDLINPLTGTSPRNLYLTHSIMWDGALLP